jgi:hypothetical protein
MAIKYTNNPPKFTQIWNFCLKMYHLATLIMNLLATLQLGQPPLFAGANAKDTLLPFSLWVVGGENYICIILTFGNRDDLTLKNRVARWYSFKPKFPF